MIFTCYPILDSYGVFTVPVGSRLLWDCADQAKSIAPGNPISHSSISFNLILNLNSHLPSFSSFVKGVAGMLSHQDLTHSDNLGGLSGGPSSEALPAHSLIRADPTPPSLPPDNATGVHTMSAPPLIQPKLFEYDVEKQMVFFVPIILRK